MKTPVMQFSELTSIDDLPEFLGISSHSLKEAIFSTEVSYESFFIAKRKGGKREIEAPTDNLKKIQAALNKCLQIEYCRVRPDCAHGFIAKNMETKQAKNIVTNAALHIGAKQLLNIDLLNFFHGIDIWRVKRTFMSYPFYFSNDFASCLAILTSYKDRLPMGAPTSPVISNFACFLLDRKLMRYANDNSLRFSRYADDLTFSTDEEITKQHVKQIEEIIQSENFFVNESKTRIQRNTGRQTVTGLKVNEKVNVDRKYIRSIRAMLHKLEMYGVQRSTCGNQTPEQFHNVLKGKIDFLKMVKGGEDPIYAALHDKYKRLSLTCY